MLIHYTNLIQLYHLFNFYLNFDETLQFLPGILYSFHVFIIIFFPDSIILYLYLIEKPLLLN